MPHREHTAPGRAIIRELYELAGHSLTAPAPTSDAAATGAEPHLAVADDAPGRACCETAGRPLFFVLVAAAVVRVALVWAFGSNPPVITDAQDYDRLAVRLAETGSYVDDQGQPTSLRPPLFPAVVAAIYRRFGVENYLAVSAALAGLSLATVLLAYLLGREAYSPQVGVGAAAIVAFYPTLLAYNQFFLSEVLFTFFVTAGALMSVRVAKTGGLAPAVVLGLCLGLGALTRSVLWLFAPVLALGLALLGAARPGKRLAAAAVTLLVFGATIAPWAWRNTKLQNTLTFIDVMGGRNVMMGNYEYTPLERSWATIESQTGDRAWYVVLGASLPQHGPLTQGQLDKAAMKYGVEYFFAHPQQSFARSIVKFFNFWQLEREIVAGLRQGFFGNVPRAATLALAILVCGAYAATIFAAIFGVCVAPPGSRGTLLLLLAWVAFPCAIHTVAFAHSRYHLPLIPILAVFAAAAYCSRREIWQRRRSWAFALATLACAILAGSWVREFVMVDLKWFV
jgi:4-amino-4-deoxy-L-arabinose transferase-like glycosyltransferase